MNIDRLIDKYFKGESSRIAIEVFDDTSIYHVYSDIVKMLNDYPEIELTVLQAMAYCFYEVLDNVLTHSEKRVGTVLTLFDEKNTKVKILVVDDGIGINKSLSCNPKYFGISETEALRLCLQDSVTDGKGMGYGLYSIMQLIRNAGSILIIHSGNSLLTYDGKEIKVSSVDFWQGTIVYFELHSNKVIDPHQVLEGRADVESGYDQLFDADDNLDNLW